MPINDNAFAFKGNDSNTSSKRVYTLIREQSYQLQFLGVTEKQEASYDTRNKPAVEQVLVDRVEFKFVLVLPGADEAQTALEALSGDERDAAFAKFKAKYQEKGHGRFFWLTVNKVISKGGEGKKVSNLYILIRGLLNQGLDLSAEQMKNVASLLNALEAEVPAPQFYGIVTADGGKNRLSKISGRVPEDEVLPSWRKLGRVADPREADDTPNIFCEVSGEAIHGYELTFGKDAGKWVSNSEAAAASKERYGKVLSPSEIAKAKRAAVTAAPVGAGAEELPF
jgi:hypothetical protein